MIPFLDSTDPRLGINVVAAQTQDSTTRFAIRAVLDAAGPPGDRAIGAPALGYPVRVLGVRIGDIVTCLLNPVVTEAGSFVLSRGEQSPHTGAMRRNVWRATTLVLSGTSINAQPARLIIPQGIAIAVQQALDLMDQPDPFSWMTPFHYLWRRIRQSDHARRFHSVSEALFQAPMAEGTKVRLGDDVLDSADPLLPVQAMDRAILALLLQFTGMRTLFFPHGDPRIGLAVALSLVSPSVKVLLDAGNYPAQQVRQLGLTACILPADPPPTQNLDAVVLDLSQPVPDMAELARAVSGASGAVIGISSRPDTQTEDIFQRHFACLCRFDLHDGSVLYMARKSVFVPDEVRARLMLAAARIGATNAFAGLFTGQWLLRKDGRQVPL